MKAYQIIENGKPLKEKNIETPKPKGKEVLIKTVACGVCHSDVHIHDGYFDLGGGAKLPTPLLEPLTMGHEVFGKIVDTGEEVSKVKIGEKYVVYPWIGCGDCELCNNDKTHYCMNNSNIGINFNNPQYNLDICGNMRIGHLISNSDETHNADTGTGYLGGTAPTSTVFTVNTSVDSNESSHAMIAYCWHNIVGYQKFGVYTGNGNADGPYVNVGFRPRIVITKMTNGTYSEHWDIWDSVDDTKGDPCGNDIEELQRTNTSTEGTSSTIDINKGIKSIKNQNFSKFENNSNYQVNTITQNNIFNQNSGNNFSNLFKS